MGEDFDEKSDDFTLEKIMSLNLERNAKQIGELAENAAKELRIEKELKQIEFTWTNDPSTDIQIETYKSKNSDTQYFKIMSTDKIYEMIEDNAGKLSNHKSGAFYKHFEETIDTWENNITIISEVLEALLQVQQKWGYLESIFSATEDIGRQLASEKAIFEKVNAAFLEEM